MEEEKEGFVRGRWRERVEECLIKIGSGSSELAWVRWCKEMSV